MHADKESAESILTAQHAEDELNRRSRKNQAQIDDVLTGGGIFRRRLHSQQFSRCDSLPTELTARIQRGGDKNLEAKRREGEASPLLGME